MRALAAWIARFRSLAGQNRAGRLEEELSHHLELLTGDYIRRGMPENEARYAARRQVGNVTSLQQTYREQSGIPMLENIWRDFKFALRTLGRTPSYTISCTATLAVGLGSMITVLCIVSAVIWKPLPYPSPSRLVAFRS